MSAPPVSLVETLQERYRIERELGRGGMATVWLAQDLRHDRKVGLKVLRPELSAVIGAERFLAEIRTTANLQHPNILPLFDSGQTPPRADGTPGALVYYVMPFVEGESLRDRLIREKQLPIGDALRIAGEIAAALDYAHRRGVIHRDIKPENVLLHDGRALVADFGLALAVHGAGESRLTETGMSLGTPHYMSPEQAMGEREITPRSDVYALGCVLYEMLTGEPPFTGPTAQAIVARVMTESPRSLTVQRHTIPPHVEAAVLVALEKLPADRFASAAEFASALDEESATRRTVPVRSALPPRRAGWRMALLAGPGILTVLAAALTARVVSSRWAAPTVTPRRWSIVLPDSAPLAYIGGGTLGVGRLALALSPDGTTLVYVARRGTGSQLFRRRLDEPEVSAITGTEGAYDPFFSPDGQWIGFFVGAELRKVLATGGSPVTLAQVAEPVGASWSDDGRILVTPREGTVLGWVPASGGVVLPVALARGLTLGWPALLPDERRAIATFSFPGGSEGIGVADLTTGKSVALTARGPVPADSAIASDILVGSHPRFLSPAYLAYLVGGRLVVAPFDPQTLRLRRAPVEMVNGVRREAAGQGQYLVTPDGTLIFAEGVVASTGALVWADAAGRIDSLPFPSQGYGTFDLSPDGRRVVALVYPPSSAVELWVLDLEHGQSAKVATHGIPAVPRWWPDGRRIVFTERSPSPPYASATVRQYPGSAARDTLLAGWSVNEVSVDTTRAEALLSRDLSFGVWLARLGDSVAPVPVDPFPTAWGGTFSRDGRWIAYTSNESGRYEIYVVRRDLEGERQKVSLAGGEEPRWSPRGDRLIYRWGQDWLAVPVPRAPATEFGPARRVLSGSFVNVADRSHDVGPDGRHLLIMGPREETTTRLEVITGWMDEVRRKAPVQAK